jgi:transposase InsO family protein
LRHWAAEFRLGGVAVQPLGRPLAASSRPQQEEVFAWLNVIGPGVGLPTLRARFDGLARAELEEILKFYRRLWRAANARGIHRLEWTRPGTVWAMDFAQAPTAIDGRYPYLLAVRDLASGQQLLWEPVPALTATVTMTWLRWLFLVHGAPWVLKMDNGSAFRDGDTQRLVSAWEVIALYSPIRTPSYNGAIEASIGALKKRTERQAAAAGHPGHWKSPDVEAARTVGNTTPQPRRLKGQTPQAVWEARPPLTRASRTEFQATLSACRAEVRQEAKELEEAGTEARAKEATMERKAITRALVAHDLLLFKRRRISAPIKRPKVASGT